MDDPKEHALVVQALTCGLSNCVEWCDDRTRLRIRNDPDLRGLTANSIKRELLAYVERGGEVIQVAEQREGHRSDYRFYYKAIVPFDDFPRGLFVEMRLSDDDPDYPEVQIVNAHPQRTSR